MLILGHKNSTERRGGAWKDDQAAELQMIGLVTGRRLQRHNIGGWSCPTTCRFTCESVLRLISPPCIWTSLYHTFQTPRLSVNRESVWRSVCGTKTEEGGRRILRRKREGSEKERKKHLDFYCFYQARLTCSGSPHTHTHSDSVMTNAWCPHACYLYNSLPNRTT